MRLDEARAMFRAQDAGAPPPPPGAAPGTAAEAVERLRSTVPPVPDPVRDPDDPLGPRRPSGVAAAVRRARETSGRPRPPGTSTTTGTPPVRRRPPASIDSTGRDATLRVGKHSGARISDLARTRDGRGYLGWILDSDFPDDLKAIVRFQLEAVHVEADPLTIPGSSPLDDDDVPF